MIAKSTCGAFMRRWRDGCTNRCSTSPIGGNDKDSECLCHGEKRSSATRVFTDDVFLPSSLYRPSTKPRTVTLHPEPIVPIWMATLHENWYEPRGGNSCMTMKSVSAHNPRAPDIQCLYCAPALPKMPERGDEPESPETFCHPRGCISSESSFRDPCLACRTVETDMSEHLKRV